MHRSDPNHTRGRQAATLIFLLPLFLLTLTRPPALAERQAQSRPVVDRGPESGAVTRPGELVLLGDGVYYDRLLSHIRQARQRIDMAMFLFKTTGAPNNRPACTI